MRYNCVLWGSTVYYSYSIRIIFSSIIPQTRWVCILHSRWPSALSLWSEACRFIGFDVSGGLILSRCVSCTYLSPSPPALHFWAALMDRSCFSNRSSSWFPGFLVPSSCHETLIATFLNAARLRETAQPLSRWAEQEVGFNLSYRAISNREPLFLLPV